MRSVLFPALVLTVSLSLLPVAARAQSATDLAARRTLLDEAQAARQANDHARALDRAQRGAAIQETPSVRLFIAEEQEALGQFAAALGSGDRCAHAAERDPSVPHRDEIIERCNAVASRARTHLGFVVLRVPADHPAGTEVRVNGAPVIEALWGAPVPVDPGEVRVEVQASGRAPRVQSVRVAMGARVDVDAALGEAQGGTAGSASAAGGAGPAGPSPSAPSEASGGIPVGPVVVGVLGVAAFGAAAVFGVLRNDAIQGCDVQAATCGSPEQARRASSDGVFYNDAADVALIAGGVLVAGAAVWFVVDRVTSGPRSGERRAAQRRGVVPVVGAGFAGVRGTF